MFTNVNISNSQMYDEVLLSYKFLILLFYFYVHKILLILLFLKIILKHWIYHDPMERAMIQELSYFKRVSFYR